MRMNLFSQVAQDRSPLNMLIILVLLILVAGTIVFSLFLLAGSVIFNIGISCFMDLSENLPVSDAGVIRFIQVAQQLSFFLLPAILFLLIYFKKDSGLDLFTGNVKTTEILMVFILAFMATYVTAWTGNINSKLVLPQALSGIEEWMKEKESKAAEITNFLIKTPDAYTYILNLIIMAIIPAVSEELIFRGVIQQVFRKLIRSGHLAVWITALIFSAIHLQFYGFLPRLILGLIFGYIFIWTGNILMPIAAHFFNNAIAITFSFIFGWDSITDVFSEKGVMKMTEVPFIQILTGGVILFYFWMNHRKMSASGTNTPEA